MRKKIFFSLISITLLIATIGCNSQSPKTEQKGTGTVEEAMYCMNWYIDSIKNLPDYSIIMEELTSYLKRNRIILNAYGMNNTVNTTIDSAILFNESLTYCCCFLLVQTPGDNRNDYIDKFNGVKINDHWQFSEGTHFLYKRKQDSLGNYIPHTPYFLSTDVRLEFIGDGFIKNDACEIDWNYVEKWRD